MIIKQDVDDATTSAYLTTWCTRSPESYGEENSTSSHEPDRPLLRNATKSAAPRDRRIALSAMKCKISFSKQSSQCRKSQSTPCLRDTRDDIHTSVQRDDGGERRQGHFNNTSISHNILVEAKNVEFPKTSAPVDTMRDNFVAAHAAQSKQKTSTNDKLAYDLQPCGSWTPNKAVSGNHHDPVKDVYMAETPALMVTVASETPALTRKLQRKHMLDTMMTENEGTPLHAPLDKDVEKHQGIEKIRVDGPISPDSRILESLSIINPSERVVKSTRMTPRSQSPHYLRRRVTPEEVSLRDLQARLRSSCQLHDELDQLVRGEAPTKTRSLPVSQLRDNPPSVKPLTDDNDEDSEIKSDVSSAIEITDSSARSQKFMFYLHSDHKSLNLTMQGQVLQEDVSCSDLETFDLLADRTASMDRTTVKEVESSSVVSRIEAEDQTNQTYITQSSTIFGGIEDNESTLLTRDHVGQEKETQSTTVFGSLEASKSGLISSSTIFGDLDESEVDQTNGLEASLPPAVRLDEHLLGGESNDEEEKEDWVSFGGFQEEEATVTAKGELTMRTVHTQPSDQAQKEDSDQPQEEDVENKEPVADTATGSSKIILDVSGIDTDLKSSIVQMDSDDVSELTDFDFPEISKASHPVDKETQKKLTACDIIQLSRHGCTARKGHNAHEEQPYRGLQGLRSSSMETDTATKPMPPSGLFQRPTSTPFQNKLHDGSIPPRSALKRTSHYGNNQIDTLRLVSTIKLQDIGNSTTPTDAVVEFTPQEMSSKETSKALTEPPKLTVSRFGPTRFPSEEDESDDDPLSHLQCLTRIVI